MFTLEDEKQLHKLMEQSSDNYALINKLLEFQHCTISKINHEIRNPLTIISSTLQLIERQHPEVHTYAHWDSVLEDLDYTKNLLEDLSSYNNSSRLNIAPIHTTKFLKCLSLSFSAPLADSQVEFFSEIPDKLPDIPGDITKLRQLFLNLLQNALDAIGERGVIRVTARHNSKYIIVKISDSGCGIPESRLKEIFSLFRTYKSGGSGLGLPIAQSIIKAHGGNIIATSTPGRGSTFTVTLPIKQQRR